MGADPKRLSNRLTALAEDVKSEAESLAAAERSAADHALNAGLLLCEAKEACRHGEWLQFLARAGVHERSAQRWMKLHRSGLKNDMVSDLGGVVPALQFLKLRDHVGRIYSKLGEAVLAEEQDLSVLFGALFIGFEQLVAMLPPEAVADFESKQPERQRVARERTREEWVAIINADWRECLDSFLEAA
jgi:hypothetical protein